MEKKLIIFLKIFCGLFFAVSHDATTSAIVAGQAGTTAALTGAAATTVVTGLFLC